MAITKAAKKAIRSSARKYVYNLRRKRAMKESVKATREMRGKGMEEGKEALRAAYKAIDKALKRRVIKKNAAARKKARLAKFLKTSK